MYKRGPGCCSLGLLSTPSGPLEMALDLFDIDPSYGPRFEVLWYRNWLAYTILTYNSC